MTEKDAALVDYLVKNTENGKLKWEETAEHGEVFVSLRGKYTASVRYFQPFNKLFLRDTDGEVILRLSGEDDNRIETLYGDALRSARNVDAAIDEIIGADPEPEPKPITDEDIPF